MHELEAPEYFPYKNRNDPGRFWYENNVVAGTHYVKSENAEPEPIAENITPYSFDSVKPQNHQRTYLLDLGSRMAKCRCIYSTLCTCETTWKGILAIEFDVSRKLFSEILNIEEDVVEMVNTFARRTNSEKNDS